MARYTLPDTPIAAATADIGHVAVDLALTLSGNVVVTSTDQAAAEPEVLDRISEGMFISGLGTDAPSITCPASHRFVQRGTTYAEPATMIFHGDGMIDFAHDGATATGTFAYRLAVTVTPHNGEPAHVSSSEQWFTYNGGTLASIGAIVLIGERLGALD
ncbi:hypothetical protein [Actinosynnema sp. ALI-1.44]|uniref:hypothetical protein n=1 Tax=Actinosynnema sp. ALI-1.44 TaxID=1933779 RepID=UPI00117839C9|nr:hypothetical protein [Actinosynnema sp. ALI-1.44]